MRSTLSALTLFAFAAGSLGTVGPRAASAAEATTGILSGTVVDASGKPLAGATVAADSPSGRYSATTDARGRWIILGVVPDTYVVTAQLGGYLTQTASGVNVQPGATPRTTFRLARTLRTIASVTAAAQAFAAGSTADAFSVSGDAAQAQFPTTSSAGLSSYTEGTVQGAIANVPGVDLDPFGNAIVRGGKVGDTVYDFDSIPIPQGLIAEPGGNVDGAQLPTTGIGSTNVTLAGYTNQSDNSLGGVVDQIPSIGSYPGLSRVTLGIGVGTRYQYSNVEELGATPDLRWRYAVASTFGDEYLQYGDSRSFYAAEAATYGLSLQQRGQFSVESNLHYRLTPHDDLSALVLAGQATYAQYGSPFGGETVGFLDGDTTMPNGAYPGYANQNAPATFASGVRGSFDIFKVQDAHTVGDLYTRLELYQSQFGSTSAGPFWDENGFPDGSISLSESSTQRQTGVNLDNDLVLGPHQLTFGAEYRSNVSYLDQIVPTANELITSHPNVQNYLAYLSDTWAASDRLTLMGSARAIGFVFKPSVGPEYPDGAVDPHAAVAYRLGSTYALRATFDHNTVAPAPLDVDRNDSSNVDASGNPPPPVQLRPETANDFTYSFEGGGKTPFRITYYQEFEQNVIDVLPFNFRTAVSSGIEPNGLGVPTNAGLLRANGLEVYVKRAGLQFDGNLSRAFSSSASQFAYNDLNAPAVAAGHLFPVSYQPDLTMNLGYEVKTARGRLRFTPSISYSGGYPYGNGRKVYAFDANGRPVQVNNDNYVNPGANYYFLRDPSMPFDPVTNPYIGNLGTDEGNDPNTLRSPVQYLVNLHIEGDLTPRLTAIVDIANLFGNFTPTAYQQNAYLIGPPGYKGGNATYANCYGQVLAGTVPCLSGAQPGVAPYTLGNGVPTNDGQTQSVPWQYGTSGYIAQSYPLGRTMQIKLQYRL